MISVIIPTYKAVDCLRCCVRSLARSENLFNFEVVIYGDGGGEDSRLAIVECQEILRQAKVSCQAFYNPENLGLCKAINRAVSLATQPWLFFIDDDVVLPRQWLTISQPLLKPNRVLSTSSIEPPLSGRKVASCFYPKNLGLDPNQFDFKGLDDIQDSLKTSAVETGINYPFFVEKTLFDKVTGVDEQFPGPYHDPDLFLRFKFAGAELVRCNGITPYHFSGMSIRFAPGTTQDLPDTKKSLNWVRRENQARILFIKKWGAKPRSRYGLIPKTRATSLWNSRPRKAHERFFLWLLLAFEHTRNLLREWRYS